MEKIFSDRIFLNIETKETLISQKDGFMPIDEKWVQIGTIDVSALHTTRDFRGRVVID